MGLLKDFPPSEGGGGGGSSTKPKCIYFVQLTPAVWSVFVQNNYEVNSDTQSASDMPLVKKKYKCFAVMSCLWLMYKPGTY